MAHLHHSAPTGADLTRTAVSATLHCLTGCAIGEVLGMVLATWWGWSNGPSILLAIVLAFFFGYLLTFTSVRRHGLTFTDAVKIAFAADTISIAVMELIDNAFVITVPVNRWMIARGKGHAVVHSMHH